MDTRKETPAKGAREDVEKEGRKKRDVTVSSSSAVVTTENVAKPLEPPALPPPPPAEEVPFTYLLRLKVKGQRRNIVIFRDMSEASLSVCIKEAFLNGAMPGSPVVVSGVFLREVDPHRPQEGQVTTLYPLVWVTKHPGLFHNKVYELVDPTPPPPRVTWQMWFEKNWRNLSIGGAILFIFHILDLYRILFAWIYRVLNLLMEIFPRAPLRILYRYGPAVQVGILDVGFWQGIPRRDICARITGQPATFWDQNSRECRYLFSAKEESFLTLCETVMWVVLGAMAFRAFWTYLATGKRFW